MPAECKTECNSDTEAECKADTEECKGNTDCRGYCCVEYPSRSHTDDEKHELSIKWSKDEDVVRVIKKMKQTSPDEATIIATIIRSQNHMINGEEIKLDECFKRFSIEETRILLLCYVALSNRHVDKSIDKLREIHEKVFVGNKFGDAVFEVPKYFDQESYTTMAKSFKAFYMIFTNVDDTYNVSIQRYLDKVDDSFLYL